MLPPQESFDSPIDRRSDYYRQRAREEEPPGEPPDAELQPLLTAPNVLTLLRIGLVPVVVALWFSPHRLAPLAAAAVFIAAALTDWADGVLARKVRLQRLVPLCSMMCCTGVASRLSWLDTRMVGGQPLGRAQQSVCMDLCVSRPVANIAQPCR